MRKVSERPWITLLAAIVFIMVSAGTAAAKEEASPEQAKSGQKVKQYTHGYPAFSIEYPDHWQEDLLMGMSVFKRANPNRYKTPSIEVSVTPMGIGSREGLYDAKIFTDSIKAIIPGTKNFKILKEEPLTLPDGTKALAFTYTWIWTDGTTKLSTAALNVSRNGKFYAVTSTCIPGLDAETPDDLLLYVKSFKLLKKGKQGKVYAHKDPAFSIEYPDHWKTRPLENPNQALNAARPSQYNTPNMNVTITPMAEGTKEGEYDAGAFTASIMAGIPGTKDFELLKQEPITLPDGTKALAMTFTWIWSDGMTKLGSAALNVSRNGQFYSVMGTCILGMDPVKPDDLLRQVKTFKFN